MSYVLISLSQGDQLFGAGRVNSDTAVKVLLSSTHLNGNTKALEHLTDTETQNVQTDNFFLGPSADKLHFGGVLGLVLSRNEVVKHGSELGMVDLDLVVAILLASLGLCETNTTNFGMRENNSRNVFI